MILDILVFALGFLVAGLLALALLPAVWRRAMRLSGERLSRLVPLSPQEIAAERDQLRAAHAVELRRTEQRLEQAEGARAGLLAEASRREDRIAELGREAERTAAEIAALAAEAASLVRDRDALQGELGTLQMALHDATGLAEKRWFETVDLRLETERLAGQIDRDRASVAALETRLLGETTRGDDLSRELAAKRERERALAADRTSTAAADEPDAALAASAAAATRALDEARRREIEHLTHEAEFAHEQAASAERRAAEAAREVERLGAERDALAAEVAELRLVAIRGSGGDPARLRAAIAALADEVLCGGREPAPPADDARLEGARPAHQGGGTPPLR